MIKRYAILVIGVSVVSACSWGKLDDDLTVTRNDGITIEGVAGPAWTPVTLAQHLGRGMCAHQLPRQLATETTEGGMKFTARC